MSENKHVFIQELTCDGDVCRSKGMHLLTGVKCSADKDCASGQYCLSGQCVAKVQTDNKGDLTISGLQAQQNVTFHPQLPDKIRN